MKVARRTSLPKRDKRGRIRLTKGKLQSGKIAKIQIADDETSDAEAMRRQLAIHTLYSNVIKRSGIDEWSGWTLQIAKQIGRGETVTYSFVNEMMGGVKDGSGHASTTAAVTQLREWGVPVHVENPIDFQSGLAIHRDQIEMLVAAAVKEQLSLQSYRGAIVDEINLPSDPMAMAETATLFDAFDGYVAHLERTGERHETTGKLKTKVYNNIREVARLKRSFKEYKDLPLWKLDINRFEDLVRIWRNRPAKSDGTRSNKGGCKTILKQLFRFADWLHYSPNYKWQKPDGLTKIDRTIVDLAEDDNGKAFQTITKETYTPDEIALIFNYCNPRQRAMIATCVNCAFGQSEIGQWKTRRVQLFTEHPHKREIDFESTAADSWIVGPRPKTKLYGEHLLWPEVATALKPFLGEDYLWTTSTGKSMYKSHSKQPASQINNWWNRLLKRIVADNPDFPKLPFGTLRDVLPNILTRDFSKDIASLALQHKTFVEDDLLKCYANLPFKRLFEATQKLHEMFLPMLEKLN